MIHDDDDEEEEEDDNDDVKFHEMSRVMTCQMSLNVKYLEM